MWVLIIFGGGIIVIFLGPISISGYGESNWLIGSIIKGIIAIMVLENFRLNKNIKKKISNYHEISKLFSIIFGKLIFKKALQYGNSSKYDMITEIFTKKYITESKKISFKIFEQKIQKLEKNEI